MGGNDGSSAAQAEADKQRAINEQIQRENDARMREYQAQMDEYNKRMSEEYTRQTIERKRQEAGLNAQQAIYDERMKLLDDGTNLLSDFEIQEKNRFLKAKQGQGQVSDEDYLISAEEVQRVRDLLEKPEEYWEQRAQEAYRKAYDSYQPTEDDYFTMTTPTLDLTPTYDTPEISDKWYKPESVFDNPRSRYAINEPGSSRVPEWTELGGNLAPGEGWNNMIKSNKNKNNFTPGTGWNSNIENPWTRNK